jgi:putative ABC transport system ATP-binding protein
MPLIQVQDLYKTFGEGTTAVHALAGVNLHIAQGEFTAIVGPSGSGKTTLLNMIGGLDDPTAGKVLVNQTNIHELKPQERTDFRLRHIGFVFQAYNLIPVLSAYENTEFTMLLQGKSAEERERRTEELLKSIGLFDRRNNKPGELSGGQQQRVAVARALAPKPDFVLADEPTANLDSHSAATLLDIMADLNQKEGVTFVFSTHDQRVMDRARRVITMEDGKIIEDLVK